MTLLEDLITLLGVALLEVLKQFNRTVTLLKGLQIAIKPTQLRDFRSLLQWLKNNNEMTWMNATKFLVTDLFSIFYLVLPDQI